MWGVDRQLAAGLAPRGAFLEPLREKPITDGASLGQIPPLELQLEQRLAASGFFDGGLYGPQGGRRRGKRDRGERFGWWPWGVSASSEREQCGIDRAIEQQTGIGSGQPRKVGGDPIHPCHGGSGEDGAGLGACGLGLGSIHQAGLQFAHGHLQRLQLPPEAPDAGQVVAGTDR
ncbi:MAG: hypothetical protein ACK6BG_12230 [Cyanobacteriota bacterium]